MRVLIHTVPPWAPSGYGVQARLLANGLAGAGHEVTYSSYGGFIREEPFEGIPVLACGGTSKGVGRIAHNYRRANADVMITLCDLWPLDAREFKGLRVVSWLPVDCAPLGMPDILQLRAASELCESFMVVAMSQHGKRMIEAERRNHLAFEDVPVIPHMVDEVYRAGDRKAWRAEHGIDPGAFLVSTVGVNGDYPCRKGFPELLAAWQVFSGRHPDARLYMHTQQSPGVEGIDLIEVMRSLGIFGGTVGFPDQLRRLADLHGSDYMAAMMNASDVGCFATLGEGFCVPAAEFAACGTPVIVSDHSAVVERCTEGWVVPTRPTWSKLHQAWWGTPDVSELAFRLEVAYREARRPGLRAEVRKTAARYRAGVVIPQWQAVLESLLGVRYWPAHAG